MIRHLRYLGLLLPLVAFSSGAVEQNSAVHIAPAGSQNAVEGPAENFTGRVRVDPLFTSTTSLFPGLMSPLSRGPVLPGILIRQAND